MQNFSNFLCEFDGLWIRKYKEKKAILTQNNDYSTNIMWSMEEIIDDAHFIKIRFYALWKILPKSVKDQEKMLPNDAFDNAVQNTDFKD